MTNKPKPPSRSSKLITEGRKIIKGKNPPPKNPPAPPPAPPPKKK